MKIPKYMSFRIHESILVALFIASLLLSGCASPVGVRHLAPREQYRALNANVLSENMLSAQTSQILNRLGLADEYKHDPGKVIAAIHTSLTTAMEADRIFALAELSFLHASKGGGRTYFLSAAVYAYAFLFPKDMANAPNGFDPRLRIATDLYNQGIAKGFTNDQGKEVVLNEGNRNIAFGDLVVTVNPVEFIWGSFHLDKFVEASQLEVRGLRNWYRWRGIGVPLVATLRRLEGFEDSAFARVPPTLKIATTAFLRFDDVHEGIKSGHVSAKLELITPGGGTFITIGEQKVPLEFSLSSALAYTLEGAQVYDLELKGLLSGNFTLFKESARYKDNVFLMAPYRAGRIPLVLVHGTASSPARWAELINEIQNDPELGRRYQIWLFTYNTGNPILYTGGILTEGLRSVVNELDPDGKDPALKKMVVIGHSQGGLLTKLTAIDSGQRYWENISSTPFEELNISPETKIVLERSLFYKPLPFVKRIVFIATPHHGSYVSGGLIGRLTGKLISLPGTLLNPLTELWAQISGPDSSKILKNVPKSTDNMAPGSPFVKAISSTPIAPGVIAHSIIPVSNPGDEKSKWRDGVVEYMSAHIDGVESEFIVQNQGHSAQNNPLAIEEIRRILIENLKD